MLVPVDTAAAGAGIDWPSRAGVAGLASVLASGARLDSTAGAACSLPGNGLTPPALAPAGGAPELFGWSLDAERNANWKVVVAA